ncbi:MAG TPA: ankyrin repeat domain-containing protein [Vicinamibacterales bacterium]|nr:ankyrin repeat domain-containing protein [Vicinamibacterales bacterium]
MSSVKPLSTIVGVLALTLAVGAAGPAPVADAAMKRDKDAVRTLLKNGEDVNAAQGDGMTALHWAARNGDAELTQMLLYAGANVKATTRLGGYTPLLMAAEQGHATVIAALVSGGADAKAANALGTTPLMLAAASGNPQAVTTLVENGAEIEAKEKTFGQTPLMFAVSHNRVEAVKALIKAGANVKETSKVNDVGNLSAAQQEFLAQASGSGNQAGGNGQGRNGQVVTPGAQAGPPAQAAAQQGGGGRRAMGGKPGIERPYFYNELIDKQGGHTALILAARSGYMDAAKVLVAAGADVNQISAGDLTSPMLIAAINGHFDLAKWLLDQGADPNKAASNGVTPLYAALNVTWAPRALYPQPRAFNQQHITYLDFMKALLEKGADPNIRLTKKVWYSEYNFDLAGVDEIGATPFWRAAFAGDVPAMALLLENGSDPNIATMRPAGRRPLGDSGAAREAQDVSGLAPIPIGGPGVPPLQAAAGVGFGEGFAANSHIHSPAGFLPGIKFLVEVAGADVNAVDHDGNTALHHAAARGDNDSILYLVSKGADVTKVNREGQTVADMANGPVQRVQPWPETLKLLEKLGSKNNNKCVSC